MRDSHHLSQETPDSGPPLTAARGRTLAPIRLSITSTSSSMPSIARSGPVAQLHTAPVSRPDPPLRQRHQPSYTPPKGACRYMLTRSANTVISGHRAPAWTDALRTFAISARRHRRAHLQCARLKPHVAVATTDRRVRPRQDRHLTANALCRWPRSSTLPASPNG